MQHQPFLQPFIGKDYSRGGIFRKRILVVGDSHYCEERCVGCGLNMASDCEQYMASDCRRFTNDTVENYLSFSDSEGWGPTEHL